MLKQGIFDNYETDSTDYIVTNIFRKIFFLKKLLGGVIDVKF